MKRMILLALVVFLLAPSTVLAGESCVPRTGQTKCFDQYGNEIPCAGTGQDGEFQNGIAWPEPRFTDNLNGTVTDNLTGLIWLKDAGCSGQRNWIDALAYCNGLENGDCGLTDGSIPGDWRMPNIRELHTLSYFFAYSPPLPPDHPFANVQICYYWSSTTNYPRDPTYAWQVPMWSGGIEGKPKSQAICVWPVKGGDCGNGWPTPNTDFELKKFKIRKNKLTGKTVTKMKGLLPDFPELSLSDGDTVDFRITVELFDALMGDDLVFSDEAQLKVKETEDVFLIKK